jgi:KUP system potassium uptake protein
MAKEESIRTPSDSTVGVLALGALGVVFGDLGTSPLYAMQDAFVGSHPTAVTTDNVLGVVSLFVWSLVVVVSIKYLVVMMRADNRGEGGIFALLALTGASDAPAGGPGPVSSHRSKRVAMLLGLGIAGAALLYGDGILTPAVSVLSAVEGLGVAAPAMQPYIVPVTVAVLVALFAVQPFGSGRIGRVFGPVLALWFVVIAGLGAHAVLQAPAILAALDPRHAVLFFARHGWHGFPVLGAVVLCLTGGEALYADMGHFGRRPIRIAWFALAFPSLLLSYLGQGAALLRNPAAAANPFFQSAPAWVLYPLILLATAATVIASQGLITAVFSLTSQAVQLGLSPRLKVIHTSSRQIGQIYLPGLNWLLMIACLALVVGFGSSTRLAAAFGLAVSGTMAITTMLFMAVARSRWRWSVLRVGIVGGGFLVVDLAFLGANLLKVRDGGWIPLVIGVLVFTLLSTWWRGSALVRDAAARSAGDAGSVEAVLQSLRDGGAVRIRGTAVYLHPVDTGIPRTFLHNLKHNKVVHERVLFLTLHTADTPFVASQDRVDVTPLVDGFWRVIVRGGFMQEPDVPQALMLVDQQLLPFRPAETSYFLGRETILPAARPAMTRWRARLFAAMLRNAVPASAHFKLPPNRVVELGAQVEI